MFKKKLGILRCRKNEGSLDAVYIACNGFTETADMQQQSDDAISYCPICNAMGRPLPTS